MLLCVQHDIQLRNSYKRYKPQKQLEVICRTQLGFQVLPKHWLVERTFSWRNQYQHLSKDYVLPEMSESMIYTVMIRLMLQRLAKSQSAASSFRNRI